VTVTDQATAKIHGVTFTAVEKRLSSRWTGLAERRKLLRSCHSGNLSKPKDGYDQFSPIKVAHALGHTICERRGIERTEAHRTVRVLGGCFVIADEIVYHPPLSRRSWPSWD